MTTDKPRYTITVDEELLKRIDDFRFENRYPNRNQATLELIRLGMEAFARKERQKELRKRRKENK
jgi:metal-responsive CopG/Arc/MetJ family transcriptional regulator